VVPSRIFIAYYNEARILDEVTFETIKELPNMPGAVNDPAGGCNYQLEGSMILLPQYARYDTMGPLVCSYAEAQLPAAAMQSTIASQRNPKLPCS
jgi:hypothetical protein